MGRDHGVAILAEGIAEKCDFEDVKDCGEAGCDEVGRIRLAEVQIERTLRNIVKSDLETMGLRVTIVDKNIGYELRAAPPIPFDIDYTRNLGYGAIRYLLRGGTAAMIVQYEDRIQPIPFVEMIDSKGRSKIRRLDINSELYGVARNYMIRIEKEDLEKEHLENLARTAHMEAEEFRQRFSYITLRKGDDF